jgi:hypothetical protein
MVAKGRFGYCEVIFLRMLQEDDVVISRLFYGECFGLHDLTTVRSILQHGYDKTIWR